MRPLAAALALLAALVLAIGCGGEAARVTDGTTSTAPVGPTPLADRLPPEDAVPGLQPGPVQELAGAEDLVEVLYRPGDPTIPGAVARLELAGFDGAVLRDQQGTDPATGLRLLRTYAVRLGSAEAAQDEVDTSTDEVVASTDAPSTQVAVDGVPGARGLAIDLDVGGRRASVLFVTFAGGRYLHGLQAFALEDAPLPRDEILAAARDLYERVGTAP